MFVKNVYYFGNGKADGNSKMKSCLGGKGANLAEMTNLGLPVPPGFTISTDVCRYYYEKANTYPKDLEKDVKENITKLEEEISAKFGDKSNPLLVSVRSGAPVSMPGMMDTILNLGLNDDTIQGLIKQTQDERFSYDCYRRFVQMYGNVVMGIEGDVFEEILEKQKKKAQVKLDSELKASDLKNLVKLFKAEIKKKTKKDFPEDVYKQLWGAISAVFSSWMNERAIVYRKLNKISEKICTAVNIQSMVFGNMGEDSATGVAFTRNPSTGEKVLYGEFLINAQGEDVVAGIRTPMPISKSQKLNKKDISLEEEMPKIFKELSAIQEKLELHYRDMQDIEFTIQKGKLFILQTRSGKRSARAMVKIAVALVEDKIIDKKLAIKRINPEKLNELLHPSIDPKTKKTVLAKGLPASPGVATGKIVFNSLDVEKWNKKGIKVLLVRHETSPEDIKGMSLAEGILTAKGGMTSHAAVVARGMGKCCVAGCNDLEINYAKKTVKIKNQTYKEGETFSLDGSSGEVLLGSVKTIPSSIDQSFKKVLKWADKFRQIKVRTNADTPFDTKVAREFGAEGIGLCRTEHMFFQPDKIKAMREMIVAENRTGREKALKKVLSMQRKDFFEIFEAMNGFPVTIRLLDPPLHEFLPTQEKQIKELASELKMTYPNLKAQIENLHELNPMLGLRGCRLGILYPEITEIQVRAIFEACYLAKEKKIKVYPEIMIPLVSDLQEFKNQKLIVDKIAQEYFEKTKKKIDYLVGTMIELPRAALLAEKIAKQAEFFSFGTNDLTQTTYGLSRDDSGRFLPKYIEDGIFKFDPFVNLDKDGVGKLIEIAIAGGRKTKPDLKIGICGEHGGDPESVKYVTDCGVNYVSCSPFRVPLAKIAAAQAELEND